MVSRNQRAKLAQEPLDSLKNDPQLVATLFARHLLAGGKFHNRFEQVVFAVYATPKEQQNFLTFQSVFGQ
ncbi:MAG: hypothetical protein HY774_02710 [Acidobacteria bacterium]|nr:hypothetical protein [Acidobacteriota bacterium]